MKLVPAWLPASGQLKGRVLPVNGLILSQTRKMVMNAGVPEQAEDSQVPAPPRRRRLFPPLATWLVVAICGAAIFTCRSLELPGDNAIANVLTLIIGFVGCMTLIIWFLIFSAYGERVRFWSFVLGLGCIAILASILRIDTVSGELVPTFRWRWTPPRDTLLSVPEHVQQVSRIDLSKATPDDFPGFLGKDRNLRVDHLAIAPDWSQHPPRLLWKHPIGAGWSAFSVVNGIAFTLEQRGNQELVTCYDARTGELLWSHDVAARHENVLGGIGPRSTPTVDGNRVYTLGATGKLLCLDGATGNSIWSDDLLARFHVDPAKEEASVQWGRAASPLVVDNLLVVPAGGPAGGPYVSLAAFDKATGKLVWQGGDRQVSYASPSIATLCGTRQILIVNENNVTAHDPGTGRVLWSHDWPGGSSSNASCSQAVPIDGDHVLLSKAYTVGSELVQISSTGPDKWQVKSVWRDRSLLKTKFTNVVIFQGHAFGLSDGSLECVNLADGKRSWRKGRYGHGQILGVRDLLLVQAESGEVALVAADVRQFRELGRFQAIEGKTWNNLCLSGSLLLVRNADEAACYELTVSPATGPT